MSENSLDFVAKRHEVGIWLNNLQLFHERALDMRWLRASLATTISYPTSVSGIIVLLKTPRRIAIFELPNCFR